VAKKQAKHKKHIPQRTCVACRATLAKRSLLRLVRTADGLKLDPGGKIAGRGAYLHDTRDCWEKAISHGLLAKSLKIELSTMDIENMRKWMEAFPEETETTS